MLISKTKAQKVGLQPSFGPKEIRHFSFKFTCRLSPFDTCKDDKLLYAKSEKCFKWFELIMPLLLTIYSFNEHVTSGSLFIYVLDCTSAHKIW